MSIPVEMNEEDRLEAEAYGLDNETWYLLALERELRKRGLDHIGPGVLGLSPLPRRDN
jgi:hypothetical protein